eukprot:scaffold226791_cov19-Tisochrysis_lutea.AAC.2
MPCSHTAMPAKAAIFAVGLSSQPLQPSLTASLNSQMLFLLPALSPWQHLQSLQLQPGISGSTASHQPTTQTCHHTVKRPLQA